MEKLAISYLRHRTTLLSGCGVLATLAITGLTWWQILNAPPIPQRFPGPTLPHPNAYDSLDQAASHIIRTGHGAVTDEGVREPLAPLPNRVALLKDNAVALDALHHGLDYPYCEPPIRGINDAADKVRWQHTTNLRPAARLLHFAGHVAEDRGEYGDAVDYYLDAIHLGIKVPHGGGIVSRLTGNSIEDIGRARMWKLTDRLGAKEALFAAHHLENFSDERAPYADTLVDDKWEEESILRELFQKQSTFTIAHELVIQPFYFSVLMDIADIPKPTFRDYLQADIPLLFHSKRQIFDDIDHGYNVWIEQARRQNYSPQWQKPIPSNNLISTRMLLGIALTPQSEVKDRCAQMLDVLLLIKLALRAYYCEHGTYPSDLASLVKKGYLSQIPGDPFSLENASFHFQRLASDKYLLYSVGPDGNDDGGKPIRYTIGKSAGQPQTSVKGNEMGDFVLGVNVP